MQTAVDPEDEARRLSETIQLFESSLTALQNGFDDVGVAAPQSPHLVRKLGEVSGLWLPVKDILEKAASSQVLTSGELSRVASLSEPLLATMNEAVAMYENE